MPTLLTTVRQVKDQLWNASVQGNNAAERKNDFLTWCDQWATPHLGNHFPASEDLFGELANSYHRVVQTPQLSERELNMVMARECRERNARLERLIGEIQGRLVFLAGPGPASCLLRDRACLLVVDNVWTPDDVDAFSVLDRRGALLVTTRDAGLVRASGAAEIEVAELSDPQARMLVARWPECPSSRSRPLRRRRCGWSATWHWAWQRWPRWPGVTRSGGPSWPSGCAGPKGMNCSSCGFPAYPAHPSLLAAQQLGLDPTWTSPTGSGTGNWPCSSRARRGPTVGGGGALGSGRRVSHRCLGDLLARFGELALLRRDPVTGRVDLHDLQFDVARADLGDSLPAAHDQLLAGYAARCPRGWPSGPDDGYYYQHLYYSSTWPGIWPRPAWRRRAEPGCSPTWSGCGPGCAPGA